MTVLQLIQKRNSSTDVLLNRLETAYGKLSARLDEYMRANDRIGAVSIGQARADVERMLLESGTYQSQGLDQLYQKFFDQSAQYYKSQYGSQFQYAPATVQEMTLMKDSHFAKFNSLSIANRDLIAEQVFNMRLGAVDLETARATISQAVGNASRYAKTWLDTAATAFSNEANTRLAEDNGITHFQYKGPYDKLTRDFCQKHIGEVHTLAEWDKMDNGAGQPKPVSIYRGGYNCRHLLIGVVGEKAVSTPSPKSEEKKKEVATATPKKEKKGLW